MVLLPIKLNVPYGLVNVLSNVPLTANVSDGVLVHIPILLPSVVGYISLPLCVQYCGHPEPVVMVDQYNCPPPFVVRTWFADQFCIGKL